MVEVAHRTIEANGLNIHYAEAGQGPLVLLCHGFPESWYSWRHQLQALAEAGYHAVAPDMRGYGQTDKPEAIDQYTNFHLVGDMVSLAQALSAEKAVIVGHDWGAPVAWHAALFRPDRFRGVVGLSVPFRPRGSVRPTGCRRPNRRFSISSISSRPEWPKPSSNATRATRFGEASFRVAATRCDRWNRWFPAVAASSRRRRSRKAFPPG
jgi:pimeloyl-ACP methyl ester carboxylesterase